jgi:hypothetical protein
MILTLRVAKENVSHKTIVGEATELCWLEMLQTYLPKRYQAAKAMVLDSRGQTSDQIDIVIFDRQYSPFLFESKGVTYVPAESVYCVIEVKQHLFRNTIIEAGWKAASVRRLHRTSAPIPHAGGLYKARGLFPILGGLVALDALREEGLAAGLPEWIKELDEQCRLDLGCALKATAFEVQYGQIRDSKSETGPETHKRQNSKQKIQDDKAQDDEKGGMGPLIKTSGREEALISFFLSLLERLQGLATVPAMIFGEYKKALREE